ncbi:MAG: hypothetical protein ACNS62_04300 [Candidatus Cyclobacteriaceae bacterium M3_2C_046]
MKKVLIAVVLATTLFACNQKELETLRSEKQQLITETEEKDSTLVAFMESFNEIERNLAEIRERELNIELKNKEDNNASASVQQQIKEDINVINELIAANKATIEELNQQLKNSKGRSATLNKMLITLKEQLNQQVEEKDQAIAMLKDELQQMNYTVEELNADIDTLEQVNTELAQANQQKDSILTTRVDEMNTAYIAMGSSKKLESENIITKEGGFLGIGKTEKLSPKVDPQAFTKVDIREIKEIPVEGKKVELVTNHPDDSYTIVGDDEQKTIEITQPEKFWNSSKYLVVRVN